MANISTGLDRSDGSSGQLGTATPAGTVRVQSPGGNTNINSIPLNENPDSPTIERAEQATLSHEFTLSWAEAFNRIRFLSRGQVSIDSYGNYTKLLSASVQHQKGGTATLKTVAEGLSFDWPPEEFSRSKVDLGVNIIKHPRYLSALNPTVSEESNNITVGGISVNVASVKQAIIRSIKTYMDAPIYPSADNINGLFHNGVVNQLGSSTVQVAYLNPSFDPTKYEDKPQPWSGTGALPKGDNPRSDSGTQQIPGNFRYLLVNIPTATPAIQFALAAAKEIISKIWRQEDNPYITGFQIRWSAYYATEQYIHPGGTIEAPFLFPSIFGSALVSSPALPEYFWSPSFLPGTVVYDTSKTIFDYLSYVNPQCFSTTGLRGGPISLSCLRLADESDYERTWHKITRTWLVAPIGVWDADINSSGNRPTIDIGGPNYGYNPFR